MNRKKKLILIIVTVIALFFVTSITTDSIRSSKEKRPIFAVKTAAYDDGGSEKFSGLFYLVYHVKEMTKEDTIDEGYHLTPWFISIDKVRKDLE